MMLADRIPELGRSDAAVVQISEWGVGSPEGQRTVLEGYRRNWRGGPWPEGLLSHSCFVGMDGASILHFSQWRSEEAIFDFVRSRRDGWLAEVEDSLPQLDRRWMVRSRRPIAAREGMPGTGALFVVVRYDTHDRECQRRLLGTLVGRDSRIGPERLDSRHLASIDGRSVITLEAWTSAKAHADSGVGRRDGILDTLPGTIRMGFARYRFGASYALPSEEDQLSDFSLSSLR